MLDVVDRFARFLFTLVGRILVLIFWPRRLSLTGRVCVSDDDDDDGPGWSRQVYFAIGVVAALLLVVFLLMPDRAPEPPAPSGLKAPVSSEFESDHVRFRGKGGHVVTMPWRDLTSIRLAARRGAGSEAVLTWEFSEAGHRVLQVPLEAIDEGALYQALLAQGLTPREAWPVEQVRVDMGNAARSSAASQGPGSASVLVWER
jgi:hypothetical protein